MAGKQRGARQPLQLQALGAEVRKSARHRPARRNPDQRLAQAIATRPRDDVCEALDAVAVPAGPIKSVDEVLSDPHVKARGMVGSFDHPVIGSFPALPVPLRFDGWDNPAVGCPPMLGEHTSEVLEQRLGLGAQRLQELRELKAI